MLNQDVIFTMLKNKNMKKIKSIDRTFLKQVRPEIEDALKSLLEVYGLKVEVGNIRFDDKHFVCRFEAIIPAEMKLLDKKTDPKNMIGRKFKRARTVYTVTQHKGGDNFMIKTNRGKVYKATLDQLLNLIEVA